MSKGKPLMALPSTVKMLRPRTPRGPGIRGLPTGARAVGEIGGATIPGHQVCALGGGHWEGGGAHAKHPSGVRPGEGDAPPLPLEGHEGDAGGGGPHQAPHLRMFTIGSYS